MPDSPQAGIAAGRLAPARARSVIESAPSWEAALDGALRELRGEAPVDLALVFVDARFADAFEPIVARLHEELQPAHLIGCSGQAVIGRGREAELEPAISVMTLRLPGSVLTPITLLPGEPSASALDPLVGADASALIIFGDPYSVHAEHLIEALEQRFDLTLLGGMASSSDGASGTAVFLDGEVHREGAVMLGLGGAVSLRTVVAQGAEPIGRPWTITDCDRNVVRTIGNRPAVDVLRQTVDGLPPDVRGRAQRNLLVGLAIDEYLDELGLGDYLVRNLLGFDQEHGAIAINANVRVGQTLQFHFRDAAAADRDLRGQLGDVPGTLEPDEEVLGAVIFSCNGRGTGLFDVPDHDAAALAETLGALPAAGLFCNGEIGEVSGKAFLHGFTASIGLFTVRRAPDGGSDGPDAG